MIADLLRRSREANLRITENTTRRVAAGPGKTVVVQGDPDQRAAALVEALRLRTEAHVLDPERKDPAWREEPIYFDHDETMAFYISELTK